VCVCIYVHTHVMTIYIHWYIEQRSVGVHSYACAIQNKACKTTEILNLEGILKNSPENSSH